MPATRIKQSFVFLFGSKHPSVKTHLPFQPFQSLRGVAELASLKQSSHYIPQTSGFPLCFIMVRSYFKVTLPLILGGVPAGGRGNKIRATPVVGTWQATSVRKKYLKAVGTWPPSCRALHSPF